MAQWKLFLGDSELSSVTTTNFVCVFPENTEITDKVYAISYTSDTNCTASTTYTVPACNCNCNAINMSTEPHNTSSSSGNFTFGSVIKSECANQITFVSSDSTWLTGFVSGNGLIAKIEENNSTNSRNATLTVKVGTNECGTIQFIQEGKEVSININVECRTQWDSERQEEVLVITTIASEKVDVNVYVNCDIEVNCDYSRAELNEDITIYSETATGTKTIYPSSFGGRGNITSWAVTIENIYTVDSTAQIYNKGNNCYG